VRPSPVRSLLAANGAVFRERYGIEVVAYFTDRRTEYRSVREEAGLTDFSWVRAFSLPEEKASTSWTPCWQETCPKSVSAACFTLSWQTTTGACSATAW